MKIKLKNVSEGFTKNIALKDLTNISGDFPIYGASGYIKNVDFYIQNKEYIGIVKDGAGVGRVNKYPAYSSLLGTMQYILPKENVDIDYLKYAIQHLKLEEDLSGAAIPHIYFKNYSGKEINFYNLKEQKHISKILNVINNLIDNKKKQLTLLDELIKSQFNDMFNNIDNNFYIGDMMTICRGASPRPISKYITNNKNGINWIKIGDVGDNDIYITKTKEKITFDGSLKSRRVKPGDFILSNSMSFGRPYILNIDGCVHDGWLIISNYEEHYDKLFLYYLLRSSKVQNQFNQAASGATVKNLNSEIVKNTLIMLPPLEKQHEFSAFANVIDKSKFIVQQQIKDLEELLDSKMQEYFG